MDTVEKRSQETIHSKGFNLNLGNKGSYNDYAKVRIGTTTYKDATLKLLNKATRINQDYFERKDFVLDALAENDIDTLREISEYFYRSNGIYQKVVNYYASMYRFDWYIAAQTFSENINEDKIIQDTIRVLDFFDNSQVKRNCGEWFLKVIRDGVCYGYAYEGKDGILVQDLPWRWCRSRYRIGGIDAVEFDMRFFDKKFPNIQYRQKVLDLFPPEFKKGYELYLKHKLPPDYGEQNATWGHWYLLNPDCAFKFSIFGMNDLPLFINAIPEIIDLKIAQGIDRQRQLQRLLKIIVQKLPLDKNGDLIFDIDEARDIHNNAVDMLSRAIGVDVLTTFADIEGIDVSEQTVSSRDNALDNAERAAYNAMGTSRNIFNTDGNLSLEKSILADEGSLRNLFFQVQLFLDRIAQKRSINKKKWKFRFYLLETTQFNYQTLSKMYKEQMQTGNSKMLAQIALGQSQSFILNAAHFENNILRLSELMIPPLMSSTLSAEDIKNLGNPNQSDLNKNEDSTGRPAKEESELSEKTIQNKESMN